jgi:hypothetical protein
LEITNLDEVILENVKVHTGKKRWRKITPEPDGAPVEAGVSPTHPDRQPLIDP